MMNDRNAKLGVLDGLIKYMRQLELAKDEPKDALGKGMEHVEKNMEDPEVDVEIEAPEDGREMDPFNKMGEGKDDMEEEGESEEMSPLHKEMKSYFNNKDKPKIGSSMSFMVESKKPLALVKKDNGKMDAMDMAMMKKKKAGRPRKG